MMGDLNTDSSQGPLGGDETIARHGLVFPGHRGLNRNHLSGRPGQPKGTTRAGECLGRRWLAVRAGATAPAYLSRLPPEPGPALRLKEAR